MGAIDHVNLVSEISTELQARMTYDEIARTLEIPVGTAKTRMRLALSRLREALADKKMG